jgi:hypothetical protein
VIHFLPVSLFLAFWDVLSLFSYPIWLGKQVLAFCYWCGKRIYKSFFVLFCLHLSYLSLFFFVQACALDILVLHVIQNGTLEIKAFYQHYG